MVTTSKDIFELFLKLKVSLASFFDWIVVKIRVADKLAAQEFTNMTNDVEEKLIVEIIETELPPYC